MNQQALISRFEKMGATLVLNESAQGTPDIDVRATSRSEQFIINNYTSDYNYEVLDFDLQKRHLLLMIRKDSPRDDKEIMKFLCGHDETHWFVAAIPEDARAKSINDAMEALKPNVVQNISKDLKKKHKNKRHNKAWKRQGEWFFIPAPNFNPDPMVILHKEPILRSGSKPHMCEELVRAGGQSLWFHSRVAQEGVDDKAKDALSKRVPGGWQARMVDSTVYVRGKIVHPDHTTLHLPTWHRVVMNLESKAVARQRLRFLD